MQRPIVEYKVREAIKKLQAGTILFVDDFLDLGNPESIKKALFRLEKKQLLFRISFGIYLYPKKDSEMGALHPTTEEIAVAIAKRDKAKIVPTGIQALNKLGLSSQIPLKTVFLTDGAARRIEIGKRSITFKKASPKSLLAKGEISSLVIQALKSIGRTKIDTDTLHRIQTLIKSEKKEAVLHDAKLAPAWINNILINAVQHPEYTN